MSKEVSASRQKRWTRRKNWKRGFNLFLVLVLLISSLPTSALAAWKHTLYI